MLGVNPAAFGIFIIRASFAGSPRFSNCDGQSAMVEASRASGQPALMCVYRNDNRWDASNVEFANGVIRRYSKRVRVPEMHHIDCGLGMLQANAVATRATGEPWDLAELYEDLANAGRARRL
jgi:hypothetical protein